MKKIRKLSGWNVFLRERVGRGIGGGCLTPDEFKQKNKEASETWSNKTSDEKHAFNLQAALEQEQRERLSKTPLPLKHEGKSELELQVGRSGCKKVSAKRLAVNELEFQQFSTWSAPTQLGDGFLTLLLVS